MMPQSYQNSFELRHLRYFLTVAEELHFRRAAERLHIAQPSLSRQIQQLEAAIGTQLFYRTNRKVILTEAGKVFYTEVKAMFQRLDNAVELAQRAASGEWGELKLTFTAPAMSTVLPSILRTYKNKFPKVKVTLSELPTSAQVEALATGETDCGFFHPTVAIPDIVIKKIFQESLGIVVPKSHPLANKKKIKLLDFSSDSFILFPRTYNTHLYDRIIAVCQQVGFSPNIVEEISPRNNAISLVAAEMGITFLSQSLHSLCNEDVVYKSLTGLAPQLKLFYGWREQNTSACLSQFLEVVKSDLISSTAT
ncbi:LysR family transcriptional regulator [Hyella patelloides LEGE 07179]|uniref:LysR family transcriptional regulator n=1 Tax=Hyella patelloides LEGE 07179 TaxID=945734 RepID=A0A563W1M3_9CYAN|nr:LysR substrate-binding domain-containing protein [Hyella patelloides]VEP17604.1 LysR family transcriptional regulator [Hyella patelloides LEGE 07179]